MNMSKLKNYPFNQITKDVGETVSITVSPISGTPPYTIHILKDDIEYIDPTENVLEGNSVVALYTTKPEDVGKTTIFKSYSIDSCTPPIKSDTISSILYVQEQICQPSMCNFEII